MITCGSKNLIYMIRCRQCENIPNTPAKYFGQTKRALRDRFGEHRRAIQNKTDDAVPQHFNPKGHKLADVELIPFEIIISKSESVRKACEYRNSAGNCILKGQNHAATWHKQIHYETGICENPTKIT